MLIRSHSIGLIRVKIGIVDFMDCGSVHWRTFKFAFKIATVFFFCRCLTNKSITTYFLSYVLPWYQERFL